MIIGWGTVGVGHAGELVPRRSSSGTGTGNGTGSSHSHQFQIGGKHQEPIRGAVAGATQQSITRTTAGAT